MTDTRTAKEMAEAEKGLKEAGWKRVTELRPLTEARTLTSRLNQLDSDMEATLKFLQKYGARENPLDKFLTFLETDAGQETVKAFVIPMAGKLFGTEAASDTGAKTVQDSVRENPKEAETAGRLERLETNVERIADAVNTLAARLPAAPKTEAKTETNGGTPRKNPVKKRRK